MFNNAYPLKGTSKYTKRSSNEGIEAQWTSVFAKTAQIYFLNREYIFAKPPHFCLYVTCYTFETGMETEPICSDYMVPVTR